MCHATAIRYVSLVLRLGRRGPCGRPAGSAHRATLLLYLFVQPHPRLQEQPAPHRPQGTARFGHRADVRRRIYVRRGTAAAAARAELSRLRSGHRLRGPRQRFLRRPAAAEKFVPANLHVEDPARPAFPHLAQDGPSTSASSRHTTTVWSSPRPTPTRNPTVGSR